LGLLSAIKRFLDLFGSAAAEAILLNVYMICTSLHLRRSGAKIAQHCHSRVRSLHPRMHLISPSRPEHHACATHGSHMMMHPCHKGMCDPPSQDSLQRLSVSPRPPSLTTDPIAIPNIAPQPPPSRPADWRHFLYKGGAKLPLGMQLWGERAAVGGACGASGGGGGGGAEAAERPAARGTSASTSSMAR
jgi:hypothetical protein